jgi:hypothetical protein
MTKPRSSKDARNWSGCFADHGVPPPSGQHSTAKLLAQGFIPPSLPASCDVHFLRGKKTLLPAKKRATIHYRATGPPRIAPVCP